MDGGTKDKVGFSKEDDERLNYHTHTIPSEWRFSGDLSKSSFKTVAADSSIPVFKGVSLQSSCPSVSMVDSFSSSIWDNHSPIDHNPALKQINFVCNHNTNAFAQSGAGIISQNFAQFPADSGFIERAARLSCFSGGSFSDMMNPFAISESVPLHSKGPGGIDQASPLRRPCLSQNDEMGVSVVSKGGLVLGDQLMDQGDSTKKIEQKLANLLKSSASGNGEEGTQRIISSGNGSDNREISGCVQDEPLHLEDATTEPSAKPHLTKKKRKNQQGTEVNQVRNSSPTAMDTGDDDAEYKQKVEPSQTISAVKPNGKLPKDNSPSSDATKDDYIHVRARRGQATNSHSLAERVRREKISERMKFLQDLVPGCNKVTGKAVMLDEIINYVQSLQQQVEFLSMKLATVTPSLDLSIEGLLSKDILQSQAGPSTVRTLHDIYMVNPQLHLTQQASVQSDTTGILDPSVSLRRAINSHLASINGYREIQSEIPGAWGDDLQNVVQMSFGANVPLDHHELNGANCGLKSFQDNLFTVKYAKEDRS